METVSTPLSQHGPLASEELRKIDATTTPFGMVVLNDLDRFHLVADVIDRVPRLSRAGAYVKQFVRDKLIEHREYIS